MQARTPYPCVSSIACMYHSSLLRAPHLSPLLISHNATCGSSKRMRKEMRIFNFIPRTPAPDSIQTQITAFFRPHLGARQDLPAHSHYPRLRLLQCRSCARDLLYRHRTLECGRWYTLQHRAGSSVSLIPELSAEPRPRVHRADQHFYLAPHQLCAHRLLYQHRILQYDKCRNKTHTPATA